jgi:hypothetical protein
MSAARAPISITGSRMRCIGRSVSCLVGLVGFFLNHLRTQEDVDPVFQGGPLVVGLIHGPGQGNEAGALVPAAQVALRGLVGLRQGKVQRMTAENGLPCNAVFSFVEGKDKRWWLYTECGVLELADSELQRPRVAGLRELLGGQS